MESLYHNTMAWTNRSDYDNLSLVPKRKGVRNEMHVLTQTEETARERLAQELAELRSGAAQPIIFGPDEPVGCKIHPADHASDVAMARDLFILRENLMSRAERVIRQIRKIDEGSYGRCDDCGSPIPEERLAAVPEAIRCVPCQKNLECRRRRN